MDKQEEQRETGIVPAEWGDKHEIQGLATRLQMLLPGNLTENQALVLAQYSAALDANPFRGEVYAFDSRGKTVLTEGYKLLIRWARRQCNFYDRYEPLSEGLQNGDIGFTALVLREDARDTLKFFIDCGASWEQAFATAASSAVGVVTRDEMVTREGKPIKAPKGWTWEDVARKRALKNALNRAYGAPSPRDIARETWMVDDTETQPQDWNPELPGPERALDAKATAEDRQRREQPSVMTAEQAHDELFDNGPNSDDYLPPEETDLLSDFDPIPDIEALELGSSFHEAAVADLGYNHARHVTNTLIQELGQGWGTRYTKTHLWKTLEKHQAKKEKELEDVPF